MRHIPVFPEKMLSNSDRYIKARYTEKINPCIAYRQVITSQSALALLFSIRITGRDRIVVSTSRCGRDNPGSNPGHGRTCCDVLARQAVVILVKGTHTVYFTLYHKSKAYDT